MGLILLKIKIMLPLLFVKLPVYFSDCCMEVEQVSHPSDMEYSSTRGNSSSYRNNKGYLYFCIKKYRI